VADAIARRSAQRCAFGTASGCRFDPDLDLVEDWDFWLQCVE
jgi:hypothetical protein